MQLGQSMDERGLELTDPGSSPSTWELGTITKIMAYQMPGYHRTSVLHRNSHVETEPNRRLKDW